jgi:hypothetical protein
MDEFDGCCCWQAFHPITTSGCARQQGEQRADTLTARLGAGTFTFPPQMVCQHMVEWFETGLIYAPDSGAYFFFDGGQQRILQ